MSAPDAAPSTPSPTPPERPPTTSHAPPEASSGPVPHHQASPGWSTPDREDADPAARHVALAVPKAAREFQGHRAGIVTRVVANVIDYALVAAFVAGGYIGYAAILFLLNPVSFSWPSAPFALFLLIGFVLMVGYYTVAWAGGGRTVGDRIMGLRVVNVRGDRLRWSGAALRALFCTVFPLGLAWVLVSRSNRSLQDTVLRTSCIYDWVDRPLSLSKSR